MSAFVNIGILAYAIYLGISIEEYVNIFVIESIVVFGFFIVEYAIFNVYEVSQKRKSVLSAFLAIAGNALVCLLAYGFILWVMYFYTNIVISSTDYGLRDLFFGKLSTYRHFALIFFFIYLADSVKTVISIKHLGDNNWFFLRPHIRMLVFCFCFMLLLMTKDLTALLLVKIFLDGFYFLFTSNFIKEIPNKNQFTA